MKAEFLAIYEWHPNGVFLARIAGRPDINTGAPTVEEARAFLAEKLRLTLEFEREESLAHASPKARIERLVIELSDTEERPGQGGAPGNSPAAAEDADMDLLRILREEGLIDEEQAKAAARMDDEGEPIRIEGRPISEENIEARPT